MDPDTRSYLIAGGTALLSVVGYAAHRAVYEEFSAASAQYDHIGGRIRGIPRAIVSGNEYLRHY